MTEAMPVDLAAAQLARGMVVAANSPAVALEAAEMAVALEVDEGEEENSHQAERGARVEVGETVNAVAAEEVEGKMAR